MIDCAESGRGPNRLKNALPGVSGLSAADESFSFSNSRCSASALSTSLVMRLMSEGFVIIVIFGGLLRNVTFEGGRICDSENELACDGKTFTVFCSKGQKLRLNLIRVAALTARATGGSGNARGLLGGSSLRCFGWTLGGSGVAIVVIGAVLGRFASVSTVNSSLARLGASGAAAAFRAICAFSLICNALFCRLRSSSSAPRWSWLFLSSTFSSRSWAASIRKTSR